MKITRLSIQNVKRIRAVDIEPGGGTVVIGGKNAQGKTSVIDSIEYALTGTRSVPSKPIRDGEEEARIVVDTGDIKIERVFTTSGSRLEVRSWDDKKVTSPQKFLNDLCGSIAFDPLAFDRMSESDRAEELRRVAGVDLSTIDEQLASALEDRKAAKKRADQAKKHADSIPSYDRAAEGEIDISEKVSEANAVAERNRRRRVARGTIDRIEKQIAALQAESLEHERVLDEIGKGDEEEPELGELIDRTDRHNAAVREHRAKEEATKKAKELATNAADLEKLVAKIRGRRAEIIRASKMPIPEISIDEENRVTLWGVPYEQASAAERLRAGVAVGAAASSEFKIMLVRDGSLLDDESMAALAGLAAEHGLQVWIERVGDGDAGAIVIEDGAVRE